MPLGQQKVERVWLDLIGGQGRYRYAYESMKKIGYGAKDFWDFYSSLRLAG